MPLVLKSTVEQNPTGTEIYIEVLDATGAYDVDDNPGGFGTPNPSRNQLALIFYGLHKRVSGDIVAVPTSHNPLTVESFTIAINEALNGHLAYHVIALEIFDDQAVYVNGDIVYDNETPATPFIKKMVDDEWVEITAADLIEEEDITILSDNAFPIPAATEFMRSLQGQRYVLLRDLINNRSECDQEEYDLLRNRFDFVSDSIEGAILDFCAQAFNEAQIKIEEVLTLKSQLAA